MSTAITVERMPAHLASKLVKTLESMNIDIETKTKGNDLTVSFTHADPGAVVEIICYSVRGTNAHVTTEATPNAVHS